MLSYWGQWVRGRRRWRWVLWTYGGKKGVGWSAGQTAKGTCKLYCRNPPLLTNNPLLQFFTELAICCAHPQELSGDPNPQCLLKSTAVQMGGVRPYKWERYCNTNGRCIVGFPSTSSRLRSQEGPALQIGGVLPCKLEVYCRTFFETSRGRGF